MRSWWIGALGILFAAAAALAQEPELHRSEATPGAHFRTAGGATYRVVEVTEEGAWVVGEAQTGLTGSLLGQKAAGVVKRFVPFAAPPLPLVVQRAVRALATSDDPQQVKRAKGVVGKVVGELRRGARAGTAAARETLDQLDVALREAVAASEERTAAHRALEEVSRLQNQAEAAAAAAVPGVESAGSALAKAGAVAADAARSVAASVDARLGEEARPSLSKEQTVESARKGLVALRQRAEAALEGGSPFATLQVYVDLEVEASRLVGPVDPKARIALREELNALQALEAPLSRTARARFSGTLQEEPDRALSELADFYAALPPRADRTAGFTWGLMEEARLRLGETLLNPDHAAGPKQALERAIGRLNGLRGIYASQTKGSTTHPLAPDVERIDRALEHFRLALDYRRTAEEERVQRSGAGGR